jgi:uncharacterized OB-fold protein
LAEQPLSQPWLFPFDYTRTTGLVVGKYLAGLRARRIFGLRSADGLVVVPPTGYDPRTSASVDVDDAWVEVADIGTVTSWTWVAEPLDTHPVDRPFAWALIKLDGAGTNLLHVIVAPSEAALHTGLRVRARWIDAPVGHIRDIQWFEPVVVA